MKKIIVLIALISFCLFSSSVNAQPSVDMGKVVLTVHPVSSSSPAVQPGDYVFSFDNGSALGLSQVADGNYTDITFTGDFERDKKTINLTCSIRISPSGAGTFLLEKTGRMNNKFSINFDNQVVLSGNPYTKGSEGQIIVSHYPKSAGDFITGTFTATLNDSPDSDEIKSLYKVTGSFKIKKFE